MEFEIVTPFSRCSFLANKLLLHLKEFKKTGSLTDDCRRVLQEALDFVKAAIDGKVLVERFALASNARQKSFAWGACLNVLRNLKQREERDFQTISIIDELEELRDTLSDALKGEGEKKKLEKVVLFFQELRDFSLNEHTKNNKVETLRGNCSWGFKAASPQCPQNS